MEADQKENDTVAQKDRSEHKRSIYSIKYNKTLQHRIVFLDIALYKASSNCGLCHMTNVKQKKKSSANTFLGQGASAKDKFVNLKRETIYHCIKYLPCLYAHPCTECTEVVTICMDSSSCSGSQKHKWYQQLTMQLSQRSGRIHPVWNINYHSSGKQSYFETKASYLLFRSGSEDKWKRKQDTERWQNSSVPQVPFCHWGVGDDTSSSRSLFELSNL